MIGPRFTDGAVLLPARAVVLSFVDDQKCNVPAADGHKREIELRLDDR